jgi:hypothetical protein
MKKLLVLATALVAAAALGTPMVALAAAAGQNTAETAKPATTSVAPLRHMTAEVVSANQEAKTLTVKRMVRHTAKESTFTVEPEAVSALADLKPGERVKVGYVVSGGKLVAKAIAGAAPMAKK